MAEEPQKSRRRRLYKYLSEKLVEIAVGLIILVGGAFLVVHLVGSGSSGSTAPEPEAQPAPPTQQFTVEDAINHGVWALASPNASVLAPRQERPANAVRWFSEGTAVPIACASKGAAYRVVVEEVPTHWSWWAHLKGGGSWIAMAAFHQTKVDGSQGFRLCGSS